MKQTTEDKENLSILHALLAPEIYARLNEQPKTSNTKSRRRKEKKERKKRSGEIFRIEKEKEDVGFFVHEPSDDEKRDSNDEERAVDEDKELGEFIDYIATALLTSLPAHHRPSEVDDDSPPISPTSTIPPELLETLTTYSLFPSLASATSFLSAILSQYHTSTATTTTEEKPVAITECELCHRDQLPLTAHHLVPRSAAAKAVRRKWRTEEETRNLAWICRSCHSFVHRIETNESLAKSYYTVELLAEREDVGRWVEWVSRQRWGLRRAYLI
ncbi:hypothetical protein BJ508DRAFT_359481 [Ascobolus immersus RN42]|uniref:HNH domain-containing protein n=1 Tax=Ascobolus immersus RN42 TaxID=1160509 RepID=A0A3N4IF30_ASCIM|nr:hypothetical protein BJ508DRAFT_359481 [Ascobolus immersus RN42]